MKWAAGVVRDHPGPAAHDFRRFYGLDVLSGKLRPDELFLLIQQLRFERSHLWMALARWQTPYSISEMALVKTSAAVWGSITGQQIDLSPVQAEQAVERVSPEELAAIEADYALVATQIADDDITPTTPTGTGAATGFKVL